MKADDGAADGAAARFWAWSLDVYARPGVSAAALELQDAHGLNVNLLLWCAWQAANGLSVDEETARRAAEATAAFNASVTAPLRATRRILKEQARADHGQAWKGVGPAALADLAARFSELELDVERVEQSVLLAGAGHDQAGQDRDPTLATGVASEPAVCERLALKNSRAYVACVADADGAKAPRDTLLERLARAIFS